MLSRRISSRRIFSDVCGNIDEQHNSRHVNYVTSVIKINNPIRYVHKRNRGVYFQPREIVQLFRTHSSYMSDFLCAARRHFYSALKAAADAKTHWPISGYSSLSANADGLQQPRGTLSCGAKPAVRGGHLITRIERIEWIVVAVAACYAFRMTASITGRYHATCSSSPFPASRSPPFSFATPFSVSLSLSGSSKAIARADVLKILYKVTTRCRRVPREQTRGEAQRELISKSTGRPQVLRSFVS